MHGKVEKLLIKEHDCYIYTPSGYDKEKERTYPVIYCVDGDNMMELFDEIAENIEMYFDKNDESKAIIVMVCPIDPNKEFTPWKSRNPFNKKIFYGNADEYINYIVNSVKAKVDSIYSTKTERDYSYIIGYSLGGLLALYTMFKTDKFMKSACISGSLWYEDWSSFVNNQQLINKDSDIFLSLGKRENRSRNVILKTVLERTEETYEILKKQIGDRVIFKLNDGGHFDNIVKRYVEGIAKLCSDIR